MANTKFHQMEDDLRMVKEHLATMMDRQHGDVSTGTSEIHPNYAKDNDHHPLSWPSHPQYMSFITIIFSYLYQIQFLKIIIEIIFILMTGSFQHLI